MKLARLVSAAITFEPWDGTAYGSPISLAYQQSVTLNRTTEKTELKSNDENIGEQVEEIETSVTYEFSTEVGDASIENLALAFKGSVSQVTYTAGDTYWNDKVILDSTEAANVGDVILDGTSLYVAKENFAAGEFAPEKCATRIYKATQSELMAEQGSLIKGRIIVDGKNHSTGERQILLIPLINLSYEGDTQISGGEFVKLSFKGKVLKKEGENALFKFIDA